MEGQGSEGMRFWRPFGGEFEKKDWMGGAPKTALRPHSISIVFLLSCLYIGLPPARRRRCLDSPGKVVWHCWYCMSTKETTEIIAIISALECCLAAGGNLHRQSN
jgi:hypothetical protein